MNRIHDFSKFTFNSTILITTKKLFECIFNLLDQTRELFCGNKNATTSETGKNIAN